MAESQGEPKSGADKGGKKVRVAFRRNRNKPPRVTDVTRQARESGDNELDGDRVQNVTAKGELSRRRTVIVRGDDAEAPGLLRGTVVAMRGLYAQVDDGASEYLCTVRRVLRTRLIKGRHPVAVGDHVRFRLETSAEGVVQQGAIEAVEPRRGELRRLAGRRIQTIVANVDQAIIVSAAGEPAPKAHLIDRYIVAALAGDITPIVCMNKVDLDSDGSAAAMLDRYAALGYRVLRTSTVGGEGIQRLRDTLRGQSSVITGQSGVGKSSLLNAVQPGLALKVGGMVEQTMKGRHTTTTAGLIRLEIGGFVVDTPGIKSFDLSTVPRNEYEALFVEFVPFVADCKFPDCTHIHETGCAVKGAVEAGRIHAERYDSYVRLFQEPTEPEWKHRDMQ